MPKPYIGPYKKATIPLLMKDILELVDIVDKHKVKHIEVLGNLSPRKTSVHEFYDKLIDGSLSNDEAAAAYFYQSTPNDRRYKELKKRLVERLHNTVLFIDIQHAEFDEVAKAYYTCWKEYASAKILAGRTALLNAYPLMEKVLKQSIRYEFMELILDISRQLRLHYSSHKYNAKKFEYYNQLYHEYKARYEADATAEELYGSTLIDFYNSKTGDLDKGYIKAKNNIEILKPLVAEYDSYKLNLCYYLIQLIVATSTNNMSLGIEVCEKAISFFEAKSKFPSKATGIFSRQLFLIYWQNRNFKKGEALFHKSLKYSIEGSIGWFSSYDLYFLLCMHTKQYRKAYDTAKFVIDHRRFNSLPEDDAEKWRVYQAYLSYLHEMGKIEIEGHEKFRLAKFLNQVPIYAVQKRTRNVPILIIQILFLFLRKQYHGAIDRIDSINMYCSRYLRKDDSFRSNCFIKMLIKTMESDFHQARVIRRTAELRKKLDTVPLEVAKQVYETEIIPYEDLWELVLESLEKKIWKK